MSDIDQAADFTAILGAAVHDMKNSLWLLLQNIDQVATEMRDAPAGKSLADIQYEAQRLNTGLVQLLSLYRSDHDALPVNLEEQFIDELLEELVADNAFYAERHGIEITCTTTSDLTWFMDKSLITVLLQDVVINALRYTHTRVIIEAGIEQASQMLLIRVCDNGDGYPGEMLHHKGMADVNVTAGRTGLGLYFARRIASAHTRGAGNGYITLHNAPSGGGIFELRLP